MAFRIVNNLRIQAVNATFAAPSLVINGTQPLTPGSITLASTTASTLTLNLPVTVAATQTWTLNANKLVTKDDRDYAVLALRRLRSRPA